jgi:hypothetical protein
VDDDAEIVMGLVRSAGIEHVALLSDCFLDCSSRMALNRQSLMLLRQFHNALKEEDELAAEFAEKVAPMMLKVAQHEDKTLRDLVFGVISGTDMVFRHARVTGWRQWNSQGPGQTPIRNLGDTTMTAGRIYKISRASEFD